MGLKVLNSEQVQVIEQLVRWKAKIKFIGALIGSDEGAKFASAIYKSNGSLPKGGQTGSMCTERSSLIEKNRAVAMAGRYLDIRKQGVAQVDAIQTVFGLFSETDSSRDELAINRWINLARNLDSGCAGIFRCGECNGGHLWQNGVPSLQKKCGWCRSTLKKPIEAVMAATNATYQPELDTENA